MTPTTSSAAPSHPTSLPGGGTRPHGSSYRKRKFHANSDNEFSDDELSVTKSPSLDDDKRAHHNELERRRRDHIKDHFMALKASIPLLEGEKSSRALILKRAADYITMLQSQLKEYKTEIEDLKRRNENLSQQQANNGLDLKPLLASLQLQSNVGVQSLLAAVGAASQVNANLSPIVTQANSVAPALTTTAAAQPPTTSTLGMEPATQLPSGSLTAGLPLNATTLYQTPSSPQCANTCTLTPPMQSPNLLAGLSSLLQNPALIAQIQAHHSQQQQQPLFEPLTPPCSAASLPTPPSTANANPLASTNNGLSADLVEAQARLLASSLALRERQFAVAAANR